MSKYLPYQLIPGVYAPMVEAQLKPRTSLLDLQRNQQWRAGLDEEHRRSQERWDKRIQAREAYSAALAGVTDPVARAVLDLHIRSGDSYYTSCEGCDYEGWEGEPPDWPCRTVRLIADRFHIKEEGE